MKAMLSTVAMGLLFITGAASAQSGAEIVKAKGCVNCHDMDAKKVGPSFKEIATKHRGNKEAGDKLVAALRDGKGHMKVAASDAEIKAAVQYVLALK